MSRRKHSHPIGRAFCAHPEPVVSAPQEEHLSELVEAPVVPNEYLEEVVTTPASVGNTVTPNDDQGQVVELDFGPSEHLNPLAEEQRFKAM